MEQDRTPPVLLYHQKLAGTTAHQPKGNRQPDRRDYYQEGPDILEKAAKGCPELDAALQVWKDITFDFTSTDTPDYVVTPTVG